MSYAGLLQGSPDCGATHGRSEDPLWLQCSVSQLVHRVFGMFQGQCRQGLDLLALQFAVPITTGRLWFWDLLLLLLGRLAVSIDGHATDL